MILRALVLSLLAFCCVAKSASSAADPLFNVMSQTTTEGIEYIWSIPQSRLAALPPCNPLTAEVPVAPHKAVVAAQEFVRSRFAGAVYHDVTVLLLSRGIESNPFVKELWMYEISFSPDPMKPGIANPLLTVAVLMDGKVLIPSEKPAK